MHKLLTRSLLLLFLANNLNITSASKTNMLSSNPFIVKDLARKSHESEKDRKIILMPQIKYLEDKIEESQELMMQLYIQLEEIDQMLTETTNPKELDDLQNLKDEITVQFRMTNAMQLVMEKDLSEKAEQLKLLSN